jgi:hypothetical protein
MFAAIPTADGLSYKTAVIEMEYFKVFFAEKAHRVANEWVGSLFAYSVEKINYIITVGDNVFAFRQNRKIPLLAIGCGWGGRADFYEVFEHSSVNRPVCVIPA